MYRRWSFKEEVLANRILCVAPIEPPPPPDDPPPETPGGTLPGLGGYLVPRYTSNLVVSEQVEILDLLNEAILPASRMFISQGANGKIRLHNKKPVDWALGRAAFDPGDDQIEVDNISPWIDSLKYFLLIDPHTNDSEVRVVTDANYPLSQNSTTFTTSSTGVDFTLVGFSGADGASTPATASLTVDSFTDGMDYMVTLDGYEIEFTPGGADTVASVSGFIQGAIQGHPNLSRRFSAVWDGVDTITLTALYGTLVLDNPLTLAHVAPELDPTDPPVLASSAGSLSAGDYQVAYALRNEHGLTLLSPYETITLGANEQIDVDAIVPPVGTTVVWYTVPEAGSSKLRYHSENDGSAFSIDSLPRLSTSLPPDINRTGTEVMRVKAVFSDRANERANIDGANVIRASFEWFLGNRKKTVNRIDLKFRNALQDFRLTELRLRDDAHIAKIKKIENEEVNGQAIDNYFQAYRIAAGLLAEKRDADFFHKWSATRGALLLEEGDVVAITDAGAGVVNFPVWIQDISLTISGAGMPKASFTGMKYANTLFDDSPVERQIPIISEPSELEFA